MTVEILWLKYFIPNTACIALIIITTSEVERVLLVSPRIPRCSPCKSGRAGPELSASMRAWAGLGTVVAEVVSASRNPQCHREVVRPQSPHTPHTHNNPHTIISTFSDKILWFSQPLNQYVWWTGPTTLLRHKWSAASTCCTVQPPPPSTCSPSVIRPNTLGLPLHLTTPTCSTHPQPPTTTHNNTNRLRLSQGEISLYPIFLFPSVLKLGAKKIILKIFQTQVPFQNAKSGAKPERKIWNRWVHEATL